MSRQQPVHWTVYAGLAIVIASAVLTYVINTESRIAKLEAYHELEQGSYTLSSEVKAR